MSNHLTLNDLKSKGLKLNKYDAMELQSDITRIAQHGADEAEEVFEGKEDKNAGKADKKDKTEIVEALEEKSGIDNVPIKSELEQSEKTSQAPAEVKPKNKGGRKPKAK